MRRWVALAIACFLAVPPAWSEIESSSFPLPQDPASFQRVRIAILKNRGSVSVLTDSPYRVETIRSRALIDYGSRLPETTVVPLAIGMRFGSRDIRIYGIRVVSEQSAIHVDRSQYRENVEILKDSSGRLLVVNEIDVEEYLRGVLPKEMPAYWPPEALKAQAVASRTFALFKSLSKAREDYMLAGDVIGQVYGGRAAEKQATSGAVSVTKGEILTYGGGIFPAYFHSTCGGMTARPEVNWDIRPHAVLQGVACPFCTGSRHYRWQSSLGLAELEGKFRRAGYSIGRIERVMPRRWDRSSRPAEILVRHSFGEMRLRANDFRLIAGPDIVKGLRDLQVDTAGGNIRLAGSGWGHGVGMCQWGAKALAEEGKKYREILAYYYPGSEIVNLKT